MLGDQLIKNERVALVELIKNAYDADASWVKVSFDGFDSTFRGNADSRIVIEDDGVGMTPDIIENHWANPATPIKLQDKHAQRGITKKGRVIQGEKGIGRFALLKLGRTITLTTRASRASAEQVLILDVSGYNTDFIDENKNALFLDDVRLSLREVEPAQQISTQVMELGVKSMRRPRHGTRIEISHLTSTWSKKKVDEVYLDLMRLQSIFNLGGEDDEPEDPFEIVIYRNGTYEPFADVRQQDLANLLKSRAVFHIEGRFDAVTESFKFTVDGRPQQIALTDPVLTGMRIFRDNFGTSLDRRTQCGPFRFEFYVFDFGADAGTKYRLDNDDKELLRQHRIYLYRDGIRVYPYGDPDDDWLLIDVRRGTVKASEFLSNDQVVGHVNITQAGNPDLRDKTSREGLVDTGDPTADFRALLQIFLAWVRKDPYAKYKIKHQRSEDVVVFKENAVQASLDEAAEAAKQAGTPTEVREKLDTAARQYKRERRYLVHRAETTEHLAGVGLSVESATHDLTLAMRTAMSATDALIAQAQRGGAIDPEALKRELLSIRGSLAFIADQLKDMQLLFKSTKQRRKDIVVFELVQKVERLFGALLDKASIEVTIEQAGSPLVAKTTDAVLLQVLLNLFDNALYWLKGIPEPRKIEILLDGDRGLLFFADNGPGIRADDVPYIFDAFYSGKAEEGRGLGLYIARQLLDRHDYGIEVADKSERLLPGANFVVSFVKGDGE
ncbi:sensor histidine kinase [Dokdonella koreensis]|uniref:histidine kinase n=1 Tax=Dokdonella koreensis DS-123 TaxID=1300342 RepID=A0A160DW32_9GAMM|nr:sensor histidine kinase [Dokdonella koreensis]ANB18797.1 ATPase/histidine kinase/DNA gyrase B/HSP90 domain protein [Dokdonella koreensis DS-123]